jgi:hypothetical protein
MNRKTATALYLFMIVVVVVGVGYTIYYVMSYKEVFLRNPFVYGIEQYGGNISCSCIQSGIAGDVRHFIINDSGVFPVQLEKENFRGVIIFENDSV